MTGVQTCALPICTVDGLELNGFKVVANSAQYSAELIALQTLSLVSTYFRHQNHFTHGTFPADARTTKQSTMHQHLSMARTDCPAKMARTDCRVATLFRHSVRLRRLSPLTITAYTVFPSSLFGCHPDLQAGLGRCSRRAKFWCISTRAPDIGR